MIDLTTGRRIDVNKIMKTLNISDEDVITILQQIEDKKLKDDSDKTLTTISFCLFVWLQSINQLGGGSLIVISDELIDERDITYNELRLIQTILLLVDMILFANKNYNDDTKSWIESIENIRLFVKDIFNTVKDLEERNNALYNIFMVLEDTIQILKGISSKAYENISIQ